MAGKVRTDKRNVAILRAAPINRSRGIIRFGPLALPAAIGRTGITAFKREGDGGTPLATMRLLYGYRRTDRLRHAVSALPLRSTKMRDLWCDEPGHPSYNRPVSAPFRASHEEMRRADGLYDLCIVLDWNIVRRKRGAGSAIFFHLAHDDYAPTAGCVALMARDMLRVLPFLRKGTVLKIVK